MTLLSQPASIPCSFARYFLNLYVFPPLVDITCSTCTYSLLVFKSLAQPVRNFSKISPNEPSNHEATAFACCREVPLCSLKYHNKQTAPVKNFTVTDTAGHGSVFNGTGALITFWLRSVLSTSRKCTYQLRTVLFINETVMVTVQVLVVLDEAYIEFSDEGTRMPWVVDVPNLVVLRTFSKSAGLAGLRVGYVLNCSSICCLTLVLYSILYLYSTAPLSVASTVPVFVRFLLLKFAGQLGII